MGETGHQARTLRSSSRPDRVEAKTKLGPTSQSHPIYGNASSELLVQPTFYIRPTFDLHIARKSGHEIIRGYTLYLVVYIYRSICMFSVCRVEEYYTLVLHPRIG